MIKIAVIPARYASTRFPGKPIKLLSGKPIIQHVYEAVVKSDIFSEVIVATDSQIILDTVLKFGGIAELTDKNHKSGTDRICEIAVKKKCDVVVNVQGDEPFITTKILKSVIDVFENSNVRIASLMHEITDKNEIFNPNNVKVVVDRDNYSIYFSRAPIPYKRDREGNWKAYKHLGVYAFRKEALLEFVSMKPCYLEETEKLEQLRLLSNGFKIKMIKTDYSGFGIDTPEDLTEAQKKIT